MHAIRQVLANLPFFCHDALLMAKKEISYGIIPLRKHGALWEVLLVLHQKGHWAFPKGHAETDETPVETATRELAEETGLAVVRFLPAPPLAEHYFFRWKGQAIDKRVEYFLAEVAGEAVADPKELAECRWVALEEAPALLTHEEAQSLCKKAIALLASATS